MGHVTQMCFVVLAENLDMSVLLLLLRRRGSYLKMVYGKKSLIGRICGD
jgi:hypothetical protein